MTHIYGCLFCTCSGPFGRAGKMVAKGAKGQCNKNLAVCLLSFTTQGPHGPFKEHWQGHLQQKCIQVLGMWTNITLLNVYTIPLCLHPTQGVLLSRTVRTYSRYLQAQAYWSHCCSCRVSERMNTRMHGNKHPCIYPLSV